MNTRPPAPEESYVAGLVGTAVSGIAVCRVRYDSRCRSYRRAAGGGGEWSGVYGLYMCRREGRKKREREEEEEGVD